MNIKIALFDALQTDEVCRNQELYEVYVISPLKLHLRLPYVVLLSIILNACIYWWYENWHIIVLDVFNNISCSDMFYGCYGVLLRKNIKPHFYKLWSVRESEAEL